MNLATPLADLGRIYKMHIAKLEKLGIITVEDLLYHVPFRYDDYTIVSKIGTVQAKEVVTIQGLVMSAKTDYTRGRLKIQRVSVMDDTGTIECIWFNQPYITNIIHPNDTVSISGEIGQFGNKRTLQVREYEVIDPQTRITTHTARLVPVYSLTYGLSGKWLRNRIKENLLVYKHLLIEYLPNEIIKKHDLMSLSDAISTIHFPNSLPEADAARRRLSFDELLMAQLSATLRKKEWSEKKTTIMMDHTLYKKELKKLYTSIPFTLTPSQQKAVEDIFSDLSKPKPMNRLLEGDVGSGKTVVAAISMYLTYLCGYQSVLMAPTEILATQHFKTVTDLLGKLGLSIHLATGSKKTFKDVSHFDILIGTHALLVDTVTFEKLGLVVIDEQQRFGVEQRSVLREKGADPHFLTMTATPIPRTIYLTVFGDLDLSYLSDMPKGRMIIKTFLTPNDKRTRAYDWMKKQMDSKDPLGNKNQIFLICPFIEISESAATVKSAIEEYNNLSTGVFVDYKLALLHGRMKASEKQKVLEDFRDQKIDMLVATPVVEVGIDIPNATVIVIEAAERFGLSQLHQLRGRVGRNDKQSYCLLFTESSSDSTQQRLKYMETIYQGAELAELDLAIRGPGQVFGTMQHGSGDLKIATFSDRTLIEQTKEACVALSSNLDSFPALVEKAALFDKKRVSPD